MREWMKVETLNRNNNINLEMKKKIKIFFKKVVDITYKILYTNKRR